MVECGAAMVIPHKDVEFIRVPGLQTCWKWQCTFFYIKNATSVDLINLPAYVPGTPIHKSTWRWNPTDSTADDVKITEFITKAVAAKEIQPDDLIRTFISRRVLPLQHRTHKICQMMGRRDPTRITTFGLTKPEVRRKVKAISETRMPDEWSWGKEAYRRSNPAPDVSRSFSFLPALA